MANTLTSLAPDLFESLDIVSRELAGFIPSVTLDATAERAALNQAIRIPVTPAQPAENVTPGQLPPDDGDQVISNLPFSITKSRMVPFRWTGEEQKGVNTGPGYSSIRLDQVTQAVRTLVNEMEVDLGNLAFAASRASGTPGTTPFSTNLGDTAQVRKILADNGAPMSDMQCVIDTTSGASMRTLAQLTKANEAGTVAVREQGTLIELHGFKIRESAGVQTHTPGTGASYVTNGALTVGTTIIPVQTGTGTVVAGDVVTIGNFKYVVTAALSGGSFTIGAPGLRAAVTSGATVTLASAFTANFAFSRSAIVLATRAPALPEEGDMADDRMTITDPRTGMTFEFAMYKQYRRVRYEVSAAWGCANIKPAHTAIMLG
ncbi:P22 phage major capsid protein family protein [Pseudomonas sp. MWU12-2345]|uniref:P22 phage major capsid protein family protein n=1 Tax=Pseudomonas sp. MWU12-2345 TaxID=2928689 RepID=UPI00200C512B|nr:P22 phage major capsid protein family protein [Pseudomonas sp. MWU12-2345]